MYRFRFKGETRTARTAAEIMATLGDVPRNWARSRYRFVHANRWVVRGWRDNVSDKESLYAVLSLAERPKSLKAYQHGWRLGNRFRKQFNAPLRSDGSIRISPPTDPRD